MEKSYTYGCVSCDPANARRHLSGQDGVKCATGHARDQAWHGNNATGGHASNKISARRPHHIATWNVRGLLKDGKINIVDSEMRRKNIDLLGLSETHWKNSGYFTSDSGSTVYFSGPEESSHEGVAFIVPQQLNKYVLGYRPINGRIISIKLNTMPCKLNVIQVYAPTSTNSTEEDIENFYGTLSQTMRDTPKREITIVLGDFNAKVGDTSKEEHLPQVVGKYGIGSRNERGDRLLQFCSEERLTIMNTCFQHHIRRLYTWISPGDRCRNQIDYIMIQSRWRSSILNTLTYPGADCGSDHQMLMAVLRIKLKRIVKLRTPKPLKGTDITQYRHAVQNKLSSMPYHSDEGNSETVWMELKQVITKAASDNITPRNAMKDFITTETEKVIKERRELKERGIVCMADQERYSQLNKEVQRRCRQDKNMHINNICTELEHHSYRHETKDLYRKLKQLTRTGSVKSYAVEDKNGQLLTELKHVLERWKEYCEELHDADIRTTSETEWDNVEHEPDILQAEVEQAIKFLKTGKSPGRDEIPAELIKVLPPRGIEILTKLCNSVWHSGHWPRDWTESVIVPLHKKGSTYKCGNYRTIALISHTSKILLHIVNRRLKSFLDRQIPEEQAGFVKGKGTREQILNIRQIIEKSREFNTPVVLCFIDYAKAFDCVQWDKLWDVLREMGVPMHLIRLVSSLYAHNRSFVRIDTDCSNVFESKKGVRQGCILSPILFNIYGEYIIRKTLEEWTGGFSVGGRKISNLRYADDTTLVTTNMEDMELLLRRLSTESENMGLTINKNKTKLMVVDRAGILSGPTTCQGIERVESFIYLGSMINSDGNCVAEIKRRIAMGRDAMGRLEVVWKNRGITWTTKIRLVKALVFPIFLYGVETWTILARERKRIDAFEMWCWRRMLRIPWTAKRTNVSILKQLKIKDRLSTVCHRRILSYFGHIARRGAENLEKLVIVGHIEGKRSRGRSPTRWSDQLRDKSTSSFYNVVQMAANRNRWRQAVHACKTNQDDHDLQQ